MSVQSVAKTLKGCVVESWYWSVETRRPASVDLGSFWGKWNRMIYKLVYEPQRAASACVGCEIRHLDEEFESAALLGLVRAAQKWNPDKSQFQSWCGLLIRQECQDEAARITGLPRRSAGPDGPAGPYSTSLYARRGPGEGISFADTVPDRESWSQGSSDRADHIGAIDRAVADIAFGESLQTASVVARGYRMLKQFAAGHTIALIAWREDISPQRVRQIIDFARAAIHCRINYAGEAV